MKKKSKRQLFVFKEFIVHADDTVKSVSVSTFAQVALCVVAVAFATWTAYASYSYILHKDLIERQFERTASLEKQYQDTLAQRGELKTKLALLRQKVYKMKQAEIDLFQRVDALAEGKIQELADNFQGVSGVLNASGLKVEAMLEQNAASLADNDLDVFSHGGTGGPFIPLSAISFADSDLQNTYLGALKKISEWEEYRDLNEVVPFGKPIENIRITSRYGTRNDPFRAEKSVHKGMDFGAKKGENVYATAGGVVKRAFYNGSYGNMVEIEHRFGFKTRYAHLDKILVKKGDWIKTGDIIGLVGNTGRSTAPHLHYEVLVNSRSYNPLPFIKAKKDVF